ncbi:winged helix-turn-helix domain-containing protein [Streptomyces sp. NPDC052020]|uniref:winged helix-turn-helix domain-containing protein n=1 Tax=Streptomyces sp. NPDC052020 TaxID=3155677 RepID=UPI0034270920
MDPGADQDRDRSALQGVRKLLVSDGWSCRVPARRAVERDDEAVAGWVTISTSARPPTCRRARPPWTG